MVACLALIGLALPSSSAQAQTREDGAPAYSLGMGDTIRASAVGANALYFNPAGMARLKQYAVEAGYSFLNQVEGHSFGASAVDSATNQALAMGVAYNYILSKRNGRDRDGHNLRAALATGYANEDFAIFAGVGLRYTSLIRGAEDNGDNGERDDPEFITLDAGVQLQVGSVLRFGVTGQNLIDTLALTEAPRMIGVGLAAQFDTFEIAVDAVFDIQTPSDTPLVVYHFGAQLLIKEIVVARAGFVFDGNTSEKRLALGASYVSKLIGVDLGFQQGLDRGNDTIVSLGVKVFLP